MAKGYFLTGKHCFSHTDKTNGEKVEEHNKYKELLYREHIKLYKD